MAKKKKVRVKFRKNREHQPRSPDLIRLTREAEDEVHDLPSQERVSGKGSLSRYRTIISDSETAGAPQRSIDDQALPGRVVGMRGPAYVVQTADRQQYECAVRRVVKTLAREERTAAVAGDKVLFSPLSAGQGIIERVEPRRGTLTRQTRRGEHVLVANVDQVLIVMAAANPALKTNLIDRYLISAQIGGLKPIICINKIDLVNPLYLQPVAGLYGQLGYEILLVSVAQDFGIERLRRLLKDQQTVVAGQSGVGKSSLLNAIQPGLQLAVGEISGETHKGKHTTTNARLLELATGGWVVDTPGIRQFGLAQVSETPEVAGYFPEFRPFLAHCKFANCSHTHELGCRVKQAVAHDLISLSRYESYCKILNGAQE